MFRRTLSLLGLTGAGLLTAGVLAGCASGSSGSSSTPDATPSAPAAELGAAWLDGGRALAIVTTGSSSCAPRVTEQPTFADGALTVVLSGADDAVCTSDLAPRATYVPLPAGVDPTQRLAVTVTGAASGEVDLAAMPSSAPATSEYAPSAGWVDESTVAILTWGSSSCLPQVETVRPAGSDIAVRFAQPPADQICTMDMAPRVALADVTGMAGAGEVRLVLSGGNVASDGPIPVLGSH